MSSTALELSVAKLTSPRKRMGQSARFSFDQVVGQSPAANNGNVSPTRRPAGNQLWFADDDLFTIFEKQRRASIPFKWEASPGTRRDPAVGRVESQLSKDGASSDSDKENSAASSPPFTLSPSSSTGTGSCSRTGSTRSSVSLAEEPQGGVDQAASEFQIKPIETPSTTTHPAENGSGVRPLKCESAAVKDPVTKTLSLKPPPGMHTIKRLLSLETDDHSINAGSSCFNHILSSSINSKPPNRRSFRLDGLKALPFLSASKDHAEDSMLGFEEWSKVVHQQEKREKVQQQQQQQQDDTAEIKAPHQRALSMPRMPSLFTKKPTAEKASVGYFQEADSIFNDDFGKRGGLRECTVLSSGSSRGLGEGTSAKSRNWGCDKDDAHYTDSDTDDKAVYYDTAPDMFEENEQDKVQNDAKNGVPGRGIEPWAPRERRKRDSLRRLKRMFGSSSRSNGDQNLGLLQKPARLSSVSPAPPPALAPTQSDLKWKKDEQNKKIVPTTVNSPILKMCMSNPLGQALLKNVRQLRSFQLNKLRPRAISSK